MIIRGLVFLVCASLGTELRAGAINESRHAKRIKISPTGSTVYDVNGKPVELIEAQDASRIKKGEVIFKLYTKQRLRGQELDINDAESLRIQGFNPSKPTYIITHGWLSSENSSCASIRDAYIASTDSNVIVIDWSWYGMSINYFDVRYKVKGVGEAVQRFIIWLYANGLNADDLTLVGHSLGAHVMGIAGYKLEPKVNNIVGLDPGLPMLNTAGDGNALSSNDAKHVQIIHTNTGGLGAWSPSGRSDFYPNGGSVQPGCSDGPDRSPCSHDRAIYLFAESISRSFVGTACNSYEDFENDNCGTNPQTATMGGLDLASVVPGTYYLRTGSALPFSIVRSDPTGDVQAAKA